jgi:hypothetical protein
MHQIPTSIFLFAMATTVFLWAHIALALIVRFAVRHDARAVDALFAPDAPRGFILHRSYLMRVKLFFPWVSVRDKSEYSKPLKALIWTARVAGTGLVVAFLLLVADFIYLASSGA